MKQRSANNNGRGEEGHMGVGEVVAEDPVDRASWGGGGHEGPSDHSK